MDWWLTIESGRTLFCWQLGDVDDVQREDLITRARTLLDVPVADGVALHGGEPHEKLLARCTLRNRRELDEVDQTAVDAYRTRVSEEASVSRQAAARDALMRCTSEERAQVIGEIPPSPRTSVGGR